MPEGAPPAGRDLRLVVLLGALSAFAPLSIDMYLPALPSLSRALGGPAWALQLTLTACLVGLAAGQLISGPLSDRAGRRLPLLAGVAVYAAASVACAAAPSVPLLILLRLVQGGSGAAGIVISRAVVRDLYEGPQLARFLALTMVVNGVAPIAAPLLGGQILRFGSWRIVFLVLAAIGVALLAATALWLPETHPTARRAGGGVRVTLATFRRLVRERAFDGYGLTVGLAYAAMFAYISGAPFVIEDRYALAPQVFSLMFAINAFGIMVAGQLSARLVQRRGATALLRVGLASSLTGAALLLAVGLAGGGLAGILPGFFLVVSSIGWISPNATALALGGHAAEAGSASALLGLAQFVIGGAVAPLAGLAGPRAEMPMVVAIAAASAAAATSYAVLVGRRGAL